MITKHPHTRDQETMLSLSTVADYERLLARSQDEPVLIYKHSSICGMSSRASRLLTQAAKKTFLPIYRLIVQTARPLSNMIASELEIRHESPQVILLYRNKVLYHASHRRISPDAIRAAAASSLHSK